MKIAISIFTNSMLSAPHTYVIEKTYNSFIETFGDKYSVQVFCDPHPNYKQGKYYIEALENIFPVVHKTNSLSDGYVKSIENAESDYLFQLEGDWQFNKPLIKHSLEEIINCMWTNDIYHLRFNKRANIISGWDIGLEECSFDSFKFCKTSVLSNNPHIIHVGRYREKCLPLLQIKPGSKGIEENLTHVGLTGAIYGEKNYPATVHHIDGRRSR